MDTTMQQLDPQAVALAKAVRQTETGGDFNAKGKSGEWGGYQFTQPTWQSLNQKYGTNYQYGMATPEQQNELAYKQIKDWKDKGFNVGQIASMWNAGEGKPNAYLENNVGVNRHGVKFNTPAYANSVATAYQTLKTGGQVGIDPNNPSSISGAQVDRPYGASFPAVANDTALGSVGKAIGNIPSSALNLGKNFANTLFHPIKTVENVGGLISGGVEKLIQHNTTDPYLKQVQTPEMQMAGNFGSALKERYGGLENLRKTAVNDPVGSLLDVATVAQGGGAVLEGIGKLSHASEIAQLTEGLSAADKASAIANLVNEGQLGTLAQAGQAISDFGSTINPINIAGKGVKYVADKAFDTFRKVPESATGGILKPTPKDLERNPNLLGDVADEQITAASRKGYSAKLGVGMKDIYANIDDAINNAQVPFKQDFINHMKDDIAQTFTYQDGMYKDAYNPELANKVRSIELPANIYDGQQLTQALTEALGSELQTPSGKLLASGIERNAAELDNILSNPTDYSDFFENAPKVSTENVISRLASLRDKYANLPGEESSVRSIDQVISDFADKGDSISPQEAQQLKQDLYANANPNSFVKSLLQNQPTAAAQNALSSGLKQEIEDMVPEIKDLNARYAIYKAAKIAIDKTLNRVSGKGIAGSGIGVYDLGVGGVGGLVGGLPAAIKAVAIEKAISSTAILSLVSAGATKLINLFEKASLPQRTALYNTITGEIGQQTQGIKSNKKPPISAFSSPIMVDTIQEEQQAASDVANEPQRPNIEVDENNLEVILPSGKVYRFPDSVSLANFKKEVGL